MITELISVGTEILLGNIVNTNSAYLAEMCARLGLSLYYQSVVGDNKDRMKKTIQLAMERSDIVILTGGLGPTQDDLTKEVTAEVMGLKLTEDAHTRKRIDKYMEPGIIQTERLHRTTGNRLQYRKAPLYWTMSTERLQV